MTNTFRQAPKREEKEAVIGLTKIKLLNQMKVKMANIKIP